MKTIYKYPIPFAPIQTISLPDGAVPLRMDWQYDQIVLWAQVETDNPNSNRDFTIVGTGHQMKKDGPLTEQVYLNTFFLPNGEVYHVFERLRSDR